MSAHSPASERYIGIMSGTSLDAVDVVSVLIKDSTLVVEHTLSYPIPDSIRQQVITGLTPSPNELNSMAQLDRELGALFANAVNAFLTANHLTAQEVTAIGSHGQTIRHFPDLSPGFSLQLGDANTIAVQTGIDVVADFRKKDIALGGQGAPLVPAFHKQVFTTDDSSTIVLNIGGIANLTFLPNNGPIHGFDTGPGNTLIDQWFQQHHPSHEIQWDKDGEWAQSGNVLTELLTLTLSDNYFARKGPKSTGREYFNLPWLADKLAETNLTHAAPQDVQRTLCELTAQSIIHAVKDAQQSASTAVNYESLILCGGGAYNHYLRQRLIAGLPELHIIDSRQFDIAVDWVEAAAFAWFAYCFTHKQPSNIPEVTGASRLAVLGSLFPAK